MLIPFPYSDLSGSKQRPALIISNKKINKSEDRICCLITSNAPVQGIEIKKEYFEMEMLPFQSWVKPQRIFTIHERIIKKKLCTVTKKFYEMILSSVIGYLKEE